jgi:hypothetical protein
MKKSIIFLFMLAVTSLAVAAQPAKPELKFGKNGRFKILQLTDIHYKLHAEGADGPLELMKRAIELERPDLVMLTGDIALSEDTRNAWLRLTGTLAEARIPWAVVFGNHDPEYELTKTQIIDILPGVPYNLTENGPEELDGNGNYVLKIGSSTAPETVKAVLYCFDSQKQNNWLTTGQLNWYRQQSVAFTEQNGGEPLPSLAFFHIPVIEYKEIIGKPTTVGVQKEEVCHPPVHSGLLAAICESKNDIMGMFVGHDHDNNYIGCLHNICLAYGYASGRHTYGQIGRGVRVIELEEGVRTFTTWVLKLYTCDRNEDVWIPVRQVKPQFKVTYPDSFVEKKSENE